MRVVSASHHADFVGGGELSQLQLLQALCVNGVDATLLVPGDGECRRGAEAAGIPTDTLPMPPIAGTESLKALQQWLAYFRSHRCDVLHANTSRAAFYAGMVGRRLAIPVVFHCRVAEKDPWLDWLIARLATRIVANSKASARRFLPRFADKVETVYNGIELPAELIARRSPHPEIGDGRLLLCVARLSRWKRHDLVLDAFALLAERMPDLQLAMLGGSDPYDPEWGEALQRQGAALPCASRIHWLGQREDMAAWYHAADALILASREEPFGRVIVEAMAYGVPVVAANGGGPAEIIVSGDSGILVDDDSAVGWAKAVDSLLADEGLRQGIIERGRHRAGDFSLHNHAARMQAIFAQLAGRRG